MKNRRLFQRGFLAFSSVFFAFPYLLMLLCCLSTDAGIKGNMLFGSLSTEHFFSNLSNTFQNHQFICAFFNSCLVSSIASAATLLVSSLAGFGFSVIRASWSKLLLAVIVFSLFIPEVTLVIPTFQLAKNMKLLSKYITLILASLSIPFSTFLFCQNRSRFSADLIKSAKIDGASDFCIYLWIYLGTMRRICIISITISFLSAWNAMLMPVILVQTQEMFTISVYLNAVSSIWSDDYAILMTTLSLSTIPVLFVFFLFQNRNPSDPGYLLK